MTARRGLIHRAHPFTLFAVTAGTAALAFALPAPGGPVALYAIVLLAVVLGGAPRAARTAVLICLPLWLLLFLLHAGSDGGPRLALGPLLLSRSGLGVALAQGARLGAVATASLALLGAFDPSRFLDAVAARGGSFHGAYLLVATLQAAPRFRRHAAMILEAQRARGLRYRGSPLHRLRALVPLALPLVLGMVSEVDDRAMALDARGLGARMPRTPLAPPADRVSDRVVRWAMLLAVAGALAWRWLA